MDNIRNGNWLQINWKLHW